MLFHIDAGLLPGGFAGVDIFFVISGFLITGIVCNGLEAGSFSIVEFYRRRIKRIGPVLAVVVLTTVVLGILILLPDDLTALGRSAVASLVFVANLYFEQSIDDSYFASSSDTIPLLHIWSLGVEEQFYLVWPAVLLISAKLLSRRQLLCLAVLIGVGSVMLSQYYVDSDPMRAYYRLPSRVFELLAGAACFFATTLRVRPVRSRWAREGMAAVGAVAVLVSLVFVTEDSGFPGINALPVTLGTAALLVAGSEATTTIGSVLATRVLVGIGLISYSLYLWHWPILAYLRYLFVDLVPMLAIGAFTITFVLSVASYWIIERPTRRISWSFRCVAAAFALAPFAVVLAVAIWLTLTDGFGPYGPSYQRALAEADRISSAASAYSYVCQTRSFGPSLLHDSRCFVNGEGRNPEETPILLWGASQAAHYIGILGAVARSIGFSFRNAEHNACPPLIAPSRSYVAIAERADACAESQKAVEQELGRFDTVILGGAWQSYSTRAGFELDLRETVRELRIRGHDVILLGQVPFMPRFDRACEQKALKVTLLRCRERNSGLPYQPKPFNAVLKDIADGFSGVTYFDVDKMICPKERCSAYLGRIPIYCDQSHLNMAGSWALGQRYLKRHGIPYGVFFTLPPN